MTKKDQFVKWMPVIALGRYTEVGLVGMTALTRDHPKYLGWVALERVLNQKPRVYFQNSDLRR